MKIINHKLVPLLTGVLIGSSIAGGIAVASVNYVKAVVENAKLEINGKSVASVKMLNYGNQLYVPIGLVASKLGGKAGYDRYLNALDLADFPSVETNDTVSVNGNPISGAHPVIENGTTYVPAQSVASVLQIPFSQDGNQANLGTNAGGVQLTKALHAYKTSGYNSNLNVGYTNSELYGQQNFESENNGHINMGNVNYSDGIQFNNFGYGGSFAGENNYFVGSNNESQFFNLNGMYQNLSGLVGIDDISNTTLSPITVTISGDDQVLYTTTVSSGQLPQEFNISVAGVKNLEFSVDYSNYYSQNGSQNNNTINTVVDFANMILK